MDGVSKEIIDILQYLLPGFIAAWIFYLLTPYQKPSQFERMIEALIFVLPIQVMTLSIREVFLWLGQYFYVGLWSESEELVTSVVSAFILGILVVYFANHDTLHKVLRYLKLTKETSYPSEWFGAFNDNQKYVVLHLSDGRRLFGWPSEWPSSPNTGYFVIQEAAWQVAEGDVRDITGASSILIGANLVNWVEFIDNDSASLSESEDTDDKETTEPAPF